MGWDEIEVTEKEKHFFKICKVKFECQELEEHKNDEIEHKNKEIEDNGTDLRPPIRFTQWFVRKNWADKQSLSGLGGNFGVLLD